MKVTQSNLILSLIVSGVYVAGCSSSSSPAPAPADDGLIPPNIVVEPGVETPVAGGGGGSSTENPPEGPIDPGNTETPVNPGGGGGSISTPLTGSISQFGGLNLSYDEFSDATSISGMFFQFNAQFTGAQLQASLESEMNATDSCEVTESLFGGNTEIDIGSLVPPNLSLIPDTVSAGEVITLTSPAGTFASLSASNAFGFLIYSTPDEVDVAGSVPAGTTADIPGAAGGFSAFANVPVPSAGPLDLTFEGSVDTGFTLNWSASNATNSVMTVNFIAFDQASADFSSTTYVQCTLRDDGAHTLPAGLLPEGNSVVIAGGSASRTSTNILQQGASVLIVTSESSTSIAVTN